MAAYAGLIDRIDQELGRLIAEVRGAGELEKTFIPFVSDNGACPYDRRSPGRSQEPYLPETMWSDSTGWTWVRNSPFRFYKQNQFEGGVATPAIVHWPAGLKVKPGSLVHEPAHSVDVLPTIAQIAGVKVPTDWPGRELSPVAGVSLATVFAGRPLDKTPIYFLSSTDRGLRDGDWKLVSFRGGRWELYDLSEDRTELNDLAASYPAIRDRMVKLWHEMAENVNGAPERLRRPVSDVAGPHRHPEWTDFSAQGVEPAPKAKKRRGIR